VVPPRAVRLSNHFWARHLVDTVARWLKFNSTPPFRVDSRQTGNESFILFHREGHPAVFDMTTAVCQKEGFSPRVENEPNMLQTVLSLVEGEQGVSIVPACARNLRSNGVRFYRLQPDDVRIELVAAWIAAWCWQSAELR
jgi:DNA-binding transcriptional LysR family regulator